MGLSLIKEVLLELIALFPAADQEVRDDIRGVITQLKMELRKSLTLTIIQLDGIANIKTRQELLESLCSAQDNLLESFSQFNIGTSLVGLVNRVQKIFLSLKRPASGDGAAIAKSLIQRLEKGEKMFVDENLTVVRGLVESASRLGSLPEVEFEQQHKQLLNNMDIEKGKLWSKVDALDQVVKEALNNC